MTPAGVQPDAAEGWAGDGRPLRILILAVLAASVALALSSISRVLFIPGPLYSDFFGFWSFGRFVAAHAPAAIYDEGALVGFQHSLGLPAASAYPFAYPPLALLLLAPAGQLPFLLALALWLSLGMAAYVWASAARSWPRALVWLLILAPSSAICTLIGQNGFLTAALLLGGVRLLRARPWLAGALLGALAFKPQLALMVPFILIARGDWKAFAGAIVAVAVLTAMSVAAFGTGIWGAWAVSMQAKAGLLTFGYDALLEKMPTVTAAARLFGSGADLTRAAQFAGAVTGAAAIWLVRHRDDARSRAVPVLATFLASPYAFYYDLPMVTGAVLGIVAERIGSKGRFGTPELILVLACLVAPVLPWSGYGVAIAVVPFVLLGTLWFCVRRHRD